MLISAIYKKNLVPSESYSCNCKLWKKVGNAEFYLEKSNFNMVCIDLL